MGIHLLVSIVVAAGPAATPELARQINPELPTVVSASRWEAAPRPTNSHRDDGPWPTEGWSTSTPEAQGMDTRNLYKAFLYAARQKSRAVIVARHGYIVGEWYRRGWDASTQQTGYSIAKSFTSALVGIAVDRGSIGNVNNPVSNYVPAWNEFWHGGVQVRHLLSMNSGLHWDWYSDYVLLPSAWNQNAFSIGLGMDTFPGFFWMYHNAGSQVLSEVLRNATGLQPHQYARQHLWDRIGMWDAWWYTDGAGNTLTYQSVVASAQEFAKFGHLYNRDGWWDGEEVVPTWWVHESTQPSQLGNIYYGHLWWLNTGGTAWPDVPADAFAAMGLYERRIYVVPSLDLVAVRLGDANSSWSDNEFLGRVCRSITD